MKFVARDVKINALADGRVVMIFDADYYSKAMVMELSGNDLSVDLSKETRKRTKTQNAYLWALLGDISIVLNGDKSGDIDLYCNILEEVGAKVVYYECINDKYAIDLLRTAFRAVRVIDTHGEMVTLKCYVGSSKMNTTEMAKVIDKALEYAREVGLDIAYWGDKLK